MKLCTQCGRDDFGDDVPYCPDDGSALVAGPAAGAEDAVIIPSNGQIAEILPGPGIYAFAEFKIDSVNFALWKGGRSVALKPRTFDVLAYLVRHAGRVVTKQELFDEVWKDTFVSDNALAKLIKEIRHELQDNADHPVYIETIPRRGYKFIGKLENGWGSITAGAGIPSELAQAENAKTTSIFADEIGYSRARPVVLGALIFVVLSLLGFGGWFFLRPDHPGDLKKPPVIAVLPFKPLDSASRDESLEMGMAEALITRLSNVNKIRVRPLTAVSKYAETDTDPVKAGQECKADSVLTGSIQRAGDRLRVTVRFIDVLTGDTVWSGKFDENFTDIFRVQDAISERMANALQLKLSADEKRKVTKHYTDNTDAYQLYLQGQYLWHRRLGNWNQRSLELYQQALEKDQNFALAHIGVAECYIKLTDLGTKSWDEVGSIVRGQIHDALAIDGSLAQGYNASGEVKYQFDYDWNGAEADFRQAIALDPNDGQIRMAYAWFLMLAGRFEESDAQFEVANEIEPNSLTVATARGKMLFVSRRFDEGIEWANQLIAREPNIAEPYGELCVIYAQKGMYGEAADALFRQLALNGRSKELIARYQKAIETGGWKGYLRAYLSHVEQQPAAYRAKPSYYAWINTQLGERDKAFEYLNKAIDERDPNALFIKMEPCWDPLRSDPRFSILLQRMNMQ